MAPMLVALAVAVACYPQESAGGSILEDSHAAIAFEGNTSSAGGSDRDPEAGMEGWDVVSREVHRRYLGACAALGGPGGVRAGRAAAADFYFSEFLGLAQRGNLGSMLWCLGEQATWRRGRPLTPSMRVLRGKLWRDLLERAPTIEPLLEESLTLQHLARESILASREGADLAAGFAARVASPRLRAAALVAQALHTAPWGSLDAEQIRTAISLLERALALVRENDPIALRAQDAMFRFLHLSIGCQAPDFSSEDTHGNEISLADLRGKAVLVRFCSGDDERAAQTLDADRARVRKLWDERFVLVSVNGDVDSRELMRRVEDSNVSWLNAWEAAHRGSAGSAWHVTSPATILLDERGIVRHVDLEGEALDAAIDRLLRDQEQRREAERIEPKSGEAEGSRR